MTYRAIEVAGRARHAKPVQPAPILQWVAVADLVIDETYQRGLTAHSWASINRIAAGFEWSHFGALLVAPVEGGKFALIDGQHRAHGAAMCGIEAVPCIVSLLPVSAQARAFAVVNSSSIKVTPLQVYKAALASGETWALACRDAVETGGCKLMTCNGNTKWKKTGDVLAITLVRDLVGKGKSAAVSAGLRALLGHADAMGPQSGPVLFRQDVMQPWLLAIASSPDFADLDLAAFLRANRLMNLLEGVKRLKDQPEFAKTPTVTLQRNALAAKLSEFARKVAA